MSVKSLVDAAKCIAPNSVKLVLLKGNTKHNEEWISVLFDEFFPHLMYECRTEEIFDGMQLRIKITYEADGPLASCLPVALLGSSVLNTRYGLSTRVDPRFPIQKAGNRIKVRLENKEYVVIDNDFFDINNDSLLEDLSRSHIYDRNPMWDGIWVDTISSAWAFRAGRRPEEPIRMSELESEYGDLD